VTWQAETGSTQQILLISVRWELTTTIYGERVSTLRIRYTNTRMTRGQIGFKQCISNKLLTKIFTSRPSWLSLATIGSKWSTLRGAVQLSRQTQIFLLGPSTTTQVSWICKVNCTELVSHLLYKNRSAKNDLCKTLGKQKPRENTCKCTS